MSDRICKQCDFYTMGGFCHHPAAYKPVTRDVVTGKAKRDGWYYAGTMRLHSSDACGYEGRWFVPRRSRWQRFLSLLDDCAEAVRNPSGLFS